MSMCAHETQNQRDIVWGLGVSGAGVHGVRLRLWGFGGRFGRRVHGGGLQFRVGVSWMSVEASQATPEWWMGYNPSKPCLNTVSTFENNCLEGEMDL